MTRVRLHVPPDLPFRTEIPLRIGDINYGGHLGNDAVLSIAHEARIQFFRQMGYTELDIEGTGIMMTDAVIVYRSEGFYGDVLSVEIGISDIQMTQCDIFFRMTNSATKKEVALVKTGIAFFDRQTRKNSLVPEKFRMKYKSLPSPSPAPFST